MLFPAINPAGYAASAADSAGHPALPSYQSYGILCDDRHFRGNAPDDSDTNSLHDTVNTVQNIP